MRYLLVLCAVVALALLPCVASAADVGQVSNATLGQMGLSGLQPMTDVQGLDIRGSGFAAAGGYSRAVWGGASTANAYVGVSYTKNASAGGTTNSFAGVQKSASIDVVSPRLNGSVTLTITRGAIAVGSSTAWAK